MWTVALSSLKQCAKTYEIRHTPTPVRVTEALQAAVLEGGVAGGTSHDPRGQGRDFYCVLAWRSVFDLSLSGRPG